MLPIYTAYRGITYRVKTAEILKRYEEKYYVQFIELSESNSMEEILLEVIAQYRRNPAGVIKGFAELRLEMDPNNKIFTLIYLLKS